MPFNIEQASSNELVNTAAPNDPQTAVRKPKRTTARMRSGGKPPRRVRDAAYHSPSTVAPMPVRKRGPMSTHVRRQPSLIPPELRARKPYPSA
ncbi:hypothetical protein M408DRAFT_330105 [Serendipita vermifera MAFF 305830]|uniref:Uncharacterized protein n=1 Tax=Serendipita vermifera MAFF 305830 TaxID=933852 RepID=A0A0C2WMD0_SERVB|nr:hypothetical protein M408DRAFT_330105 [Serendipita vermifera MAFF 305830]